MSGEAVPSEHAHDHDGQAGSMSIGDFINTYVFSTSCENTFSSYHGRAAIESFILSSEAQSCVLMLLQLCCFHMKVQIG